VEITDKRSGEARAQHGQLVSDAQGWASGTPRPKPPTSNKEPGSGLETYDLDGADCRCSAMPVSGEGRSRRPLIKRTPYLVEEVDHIAVLGSSGDLHLFLITSVRTLIAGIGAQPW